MNPGNDPPLVPGLPLLGSALAMMRDATAFFVENYKRYGPVFRVRAAHQRFLILCGPEAATFFMRPPGAHYLGSHQAYRRMIAATGAEHIMVVSDGDLHQ